MTTVLLVLGKEKRFQTHLAICKDVTCSAENSFRTNTSSSNTEVLADHSRNLVFTTTCSW